MDFAKLQLKAYEQETNKMKATLKTNRVLKKEPTFLEEKDEKIAKLQKLLSIQADHNKVIMSLVKDESTPSTQKSLPETKAALKKTNKNISAKRAR